MLFRSGYYKDSCDAIVSVKTKWILGDIITLVGRIINLNFQKKEMTQIAKFRGFNGYDDFQINDTRAFLGEIIYYFSKLLKNRKLNP